MNRKLRDDADLQIERVVLSTAGVPLVTGLLWRAVNQARHTLRHLHQARDLNTDASHYVLCQSESALVYGLFQQNSAEEGLKLPRGVHSAAHCFANLVGAQAPNAALVLNVPSSASRSESKIYVIVLEDGVPMVDTLSSEMEARNALGSQERPMWSNSPYSYPNAQTADFDWLASGANKASKVAVIPVNPWPWVAGAVVMLAVAVGYWLVLQAQKMQAARVQAELDAEQDPAPKYLKALGQQALQMASVRPEVLHMVQGMFEQSVLVPGWRMASITCQVRAQRCITQWSRNGGNFDELRAALPKQTLVQKPLEANASDAVSPSVSLNN